MLLHNFPYRLHGKNRSLILSSMVLGVGFYPKILASADAPPIICITNDGKCVVQGSGTIGGDGGNGGNAGGKNVSAAAGTASAAAGTASAAAGTANYGGKIQDSKSPPSSQISVTTVGYTSKSEPTSTIPVTAELKVQVNYVYRNKADGSQPQPLTSNSVLQSGDWYKIVFTPKQTTWVYIFQTDSSGKMFQLFPQKEMFGVAMNQANPVAVDETRTVPVANAWFSLDNQVGVETLYFIATPQQDQELETRYQTYEQAQKIGAGTTMLAQNDLNRSVLSRGPAAIVFEETPPAVPYTVTTEAGEKFTLHDGYLTGSCNKAGGCVNVLEFQHH